MDRKHIAKIEPFIFPKDEDNTRIAGWFIGVTDQQEEQVYFVAPNVRGRGALINHSIEPNGEVNPSVLIRGIGYDGEDAEYHEFVTLDDWDSYYRKDADKGRPILIGI